MTPYSVIYCVIFSIGRSKDFRELDPLCSGVYWKMKRDMFEGTHFCTAHFLVTEFYSSLN